MADLGKIGTIENVPICETVKNRNLKSLLHKRLEAIIIFTDNYKII